MADHQRIHPVRNDVKAPARPATSSDKDDYSATAPYKSILLWTIYVLILLLVMVSAIVGITFLVLRPKLPKFSVHGVRMTQFDLGLDDTVSATFAAKIMCENPNERIGVRYEAGSHVSAWYGGEKVSEASLPEFYQGHRDRRVIRMKMTGRSGNATGLLTSLLEASGAIPVEVRVELPVRVEVGALTLPKVRLLARCEFEVDDERAPSFRIRNSECKFGFRL